MGNKKNIIIVLIVVCLIAAIGIGGFFVVRELNKDDDADSKKTAHSDEKEDSEDDEKEEKKEKKSDSSISSVDSIIKEFAEALSDSDKLEDFAEKKVNLRAWYAMSALEEDDDLDVEDYDEVEKAFEKIYKNAKKSDYESDEIKDSVKLFFGLLTMYISTSGEDAKIEVKNIGELTEGYDAFKFLQQVEFTMQVTVDGESTESDWRAIFYDGKMVMASPDEEYETSDDDDDYDYDDLDLDDDDDDNDDDDWYWDDDDNDDDDDLDF